MDRPPPSRQINRSMTSNYTPFAPRPKNPLPLVLASAAFALAAFMVVDRTGFLDPAPTSTPRVATPRGELAPYEESFISIFESTSPSVAHINTSSMVRTWSGISKRQGSGSGFVWDNAGTIVTNHHVIDGANEVVVTVAGRNYLADVLNSSPNHDLAILKLRGKSSNLRPISLGTSKDLKVGQAAIAIGNPFGFDQTMTTGIVSALNRTLQAESGNIMRGLIQVDAAINPGNSGGPLLDSAGRLIGVTTAIYSPSGANAGLGFAVPVDVVNLIVPRLIANKPTTAILGVTSEYERFNLDPKLGFRSGVIVTEVIDDYGAKAAGLQPFIIGNDRSITKYGDVIVAIDNQQVRSFSELPRLLANRNSGDMVTITAIRGLPDNPTKVTLQIEMRTQGDPMHSGM
jgi:S1-C subfamily serine protease